MGGWMIALSEWNGNMMLMLMAFPSTTTALSFVYFSSVPNGMNEQVK